ncbi:MAG: LOG family protein [Phycisphaerales bacterium]
MTAPESRSTPAGVHELVRSAGGDPTTRSGRMVTEMVQTCLKLVDDGHDTGQLKLINSALKEMRYAYNVFNDWIGTPKVTIFGSARTPPEHADYIAAVDFSRLMAEKHWMSITGAGDGIMKAGHEGPSREKSFGLSIRLPFETTANTVIEGDSKLINFRYFFTRKLMFLTHADAIAVFPGGYGTQDELFESLVLMQTGKSNIVPTVLLEGEGGVYWDHWHTYVEKNLGDTGWISPEDFRLFYIAKSPEDGVQHILDFYRVYHSSRYVQDQLVIRLKHEISDAAIATLNEEFGSLVRTGAIERSAALDIEEEHTDLPRLVFHHSRYHYGRVRCLIDRINELGAAGA